MELTLHGYWRSGAAYRMRIALNLKGIAYAQASHDLRRGEQADPAYRAIHPQALVPALEADGQALTQTLAMLEWLDETFPVAPLLPVAPGDRAVVRAMAALICCDIHPLNNLRVLNALRSDFGADKAQVTRWISRWITEGFTALEPLVARHGAGFAFGDAPGMADCCLVPQVYSAERFGVPLDAFPHILETVSRCRALEPFRQADPARQPDADR